MIKVVFILLSPVYLFLILPAALIISFICKPRNGYTVIKKLENGSEIFYYHEGTT